MPTGSCSADPVMIADNGMTGKAFDANHALIQFFGGESSG